MTWLAIAWTVLILVLCWTPPTRLPMSEHAPSFFRLAGLDKIIHGGIFAVFALLWRRATSPASAPIIAVSGLALAVITELGQATSLVGRDASLGDGIADVAGVAIGLIVAAWFAGRSNVPEPLQG
jgi:VanZ family protein